MPRYYEFEVSLQDLQPRIWRHFLLRTTSTFAQLHDAIQDSFGWENRHLWEFRLPTYQGRPIAGPLVSDLENLGRPIPDAKKIKLGSYFTGKTKVEWCEYIYDFGDDWIHDVKLVAVHSNEQSFKRRLINGERSAPPEDCGSLPGYERVIHFRKTGEDIQGESTDELDEWLNGWQIEMNLESIRQQFDR